MMNNKTWKVETESIGQEIRLEAGSINWDGWDIPITRHSGAGSSQYPFKEMYLDSNLYKQIANTFGIEAAKEILSIVSGHTY